MNKKPEGTEKELLQYLVKENIIIHAEFAALKHVFKFVFLSQEDLHPHLKTEMINNLYEKALHNAVQQILVSHPLLEDSWKSSIEEALGNVPGLDLS